MKDHGILFKDEMVRALIAGLKTETRRTVRLDPLPDHAPWLVKNYDKHGADFQADGGVGCFDAVEWLRCPLGQPGGALYVKEVWALTRLLRDSEGIADDEQHWKGPAKVDPRGQRLFDDWHLSYRATSGAPGPWKSSLLMPAWAARITMSLVESVPQYLGNITEADAAAEGMALVAEERGWTGSLRDVFFRYFAEIHGKAPDMEMLVWVHRFNNVVVGGSNVG